MHVDSMQSVSLPHISCGTWPYASCRYQVQYVGPTYIVWNLPTCIGRLRIWMHTNLQICSTTGYLTVKTTHHIHQTCRGKELLLIQKRWETQSLLKQCPLRKVKEKNHSHSLNENRVRSKQHRSVPLSTIPNWVIFFHKTDISEMAIAQAQYLIGAMMSSWAPSFSSAAFSALSLSFANCFFLSYITCDFSFLFFSSSCNKNRCQQEMTLKTQ